MAGRWCANKGGNSCYAENKMFTKYQLSAVAVASAAVLATLPGTSAAQQSLTVTSWGGATP